MSKANYALCPGCGGKALYVGEDDLPPDVEVWHRSCLADGGRYHVVLADGCEFDEHRPPGMRRPADGELRACAEHYPAQFPARYTDLEAPPQPDERRDG